MFAMYRAKVEQIILFMKIVNQHFKRKECFSAAPVPVLCSYRRIMGAKTGRIFCLRYGNKCLHLASEKFVLASELNLSLATGLAS